MSGNPFLAFVLVAGVGHALEQDKERLSTLEKAIFVILWLLVCGTSTVFVPFLANPAAVCMFLGAIISVTIAFLIGRNKNDALDGFTPWIFI